MKVKAQASAALLLAITSAMQILNPPPVGVTPYEHANEHRVMPEESAEPGKRIQVPYQEEMLRVAVDPEVRNVYVMKSAQVGWSEIQLILIGFFMDSISGDPTTVLMVRPTCDDADEFAELRLEQLIRDSPRLDQLCPARIGGKPTKKAFKKYPGGYLYVIGGNSPTGLGGKICRVILLDERDRIVQNAGGEGDPGTIVSYRQKTYGDDALTYSGGTPVLEGGPTEADFLRGDQRHWFVDCPFCDAEQRLVWAQVKFDKSAEFPWMTAAYECEACGMHWDEEEKREAVRLGRWKATNPKAPRDTVSFHIWEIYSPFSSMEEVVKGFWLAHSEPDPVTRRNKIQAWTNLSLGLPFKDSQTATRSASELEARAEVYTIELLPFEVLALTAGVDVQDDRLEVEIIGWGRHNESWSIDYVVLPGDPSSPAVWEDLDALLAARYPHPEGYTLAVHTTCVDTGGHHTQAVYDYTAPRYKRRIFGVKGSSTTRGGAQRPIIPPDKKASTNNPKKAPVFIVGVDTAKDQIFQYLRVTEPGPGFCHFPAHYPPTYYEGLTNERVRQTFREGRPVRTYVKIGFNEPLDCRVYGTAALKLMPVTPEQIYQARLRTRALRDGPAAAPSKSTTTRSPGLGRPDWI